MIKKCMCIVLLMISAAFVFATKEEKDKRLAVLESLKIEDGKIVSLKYDNSPEMTIKNRRGNGEKTYKNLPTRTVAKILLQPAKGSNINVEIWLPEAEKWNGRLLGLGNGGAAGRINQTVFIGGINSGYAVATTDMGTAPNSNSGIGNKEVWKDFGFRSTHLMTVVAKQIIKAYYGKAPEYSYFSGSSTGGQQALQEAQRYPEDYDGIAAGVPGHCRTPLHAYFLWNYQIFRKCPFSDSQEANVIAAANEYMASREIPQTAGKIVSDPHCSKEDIKAVIALARKRDPSLTDKHEEALNKLFDGPKHSVTGERIFCGIPLGSSFKPARNHLYLFKWALGEKTDYMKINFGKDIDTYTAALGPYLNAETPDLSAFKKRGGKLIMYSGSADSCVPPNGTIDYYERVIKFFGSLDKVRSFFRYYIIPGKDHGNKGPGVNLISPGPLSLVIQWREKGIAPNAIQGKRIVDGKTTMDIPIYPYPMKTAWDAKTGFKEMEGPRGGFDPISASFLPPASE